MIFKRFKLDDEHQSHQECGRPLGIRLRNNILYVADAYYGLIKVNVTTGIVFLK